MNVVNWFEIPVKELKRARAFYEKVLEREMTDMPSPVPGMEMAAFPWETNAPNATGALVRMDGLTPRTDATVVYFQCDDVAAALTRAEQNGGKVLTPKTSIGEHGFIGHLVDTEGNRVGLHSTK